MSKTTSCPTCLEVIWPEPFVGTVVSCCPWCQGKMTLTTDGVSFESSVITSAPMMNGHAVELLCEREAR